MKSTWSHVIWSKSCMAPYAAATSCPSRLKRFGSGRPISVQIIGTLRILL